MKRRKNSHLRELSFRCQKELVRKLRLYASAERYRSLSRLVEDYCLTLLDVIDNRTKFDLEANAVYLGKPKELACKIHVRIKEGSFKALNEEARKKGLSLSELVRLLLRVALELRWNDDSKTAQKFNRETFVPGFHQVLR